MNPLLPSSPPKALLVDVGGVLLELHFERPIALWAQSEGISFESLKSRFQLDSSAHRQMETGRMAMDDYFAELRAQLGLSITLANMADGWQQVLGGPMPGMLAVLAELRAAQPHLPFHVLSNTGPAHAPVWRTTLAPLLAAFERIYCSHEIGLMKPDAACFAHICADLRLAPQEILFLDDTLVNVAGARAAGLRAARVTKANDAKAVLAAAFGVSLA